MNVVESLRRTFRDLNMSQRVTMTSALVVVLLAGAVFVRWASAPTYTVLYSDVDASQLSEVIDSLEAQGVDYRLEGGGSRILVPQSAVYKLRADLASEGIQGSVVPQGYELLDNQGLSVSDFRQKVDYQRALEGELARTLSAMRSIDAATVHLVLPEESLFAENQQPVTASVLIDPNGSIGDSDVEAITFMVSSSVEGLEPGQVTIASTDGTVFHAAGEDTGVGMGNAQLRMTKEFEASLAGDITAMLTSVMGPNRASVVVRAELDFDERSTESELYDPESQIAVREQTIDETYNGAGDSPVGSVGIDGEALEVTEDGAYEYARNEATTEFGVDRVVTRTMEAPGAIDRLSVAVVVDDGQLTGAAAPDLTTIDSLVTAAAGISAERGDTVEVSTAAFPAIASAADVAEEPAAAGGGGIMDLIPTIAGALALVVVAVALVLMSRGGKKSGSISASGAIEALPAGRGNALVGTSSAADAIEMSGMASDVMQLVERQPEEIATLLRSWLADQRERV
jgi:flagellar M-ring protein FliF